MENKICLITYPDSLGKNLKELDTILEKYFKGAFGGIHILPFYPSSSDRGFSPLTHLKVDESFGSWEDIKSISGRYFLIVDIMVNHISVESDIFRDYILRGEDSKYSDFFITNDKFSRRIIPRRKSTPVILGLLEKTANKIRDLDAFFHCSGVNRFSLKKIYRPRTENPLVPFKINNGRVEHLWCTFSRDQVDLDIYNEEVMDLLKKYVKKLAENGVNMVRLDAVGYLVKKRDTNSFMLPEVYDFINRIGKTIHEEGMLVLPEVHHHYFYQIKLHNTKEVDYIYDFQMPMLMLNAIYEKNFSGIKKWLKIRPEKAISILDSHDGIPVVDVEDLLDEKDISKTVEKVILNGGNEARRASGENGAINADIYQINCTYYSALGEDDDAYIIARAVQFFVPGIPQVYYVGLLAGKNDVEKLRETNVGRDINRHDYSEEEIKKEMKRGVVKRLMKLMEFRNNYPVFDGKFSLGNSYDNNELVLRWRRGRLFLEVEISLKSNKVHAIYFDEKNEKEMRKKF